MSLTYWEKIDKIINLIISSGEYRKYLKKISRRRYFMANKDVIKNEKRKTGLDRTKEIRRKYFKKYYPLHREKRIARSVAYYWKNKKKERL